MPVCTHSETTVEKRSQDVAIVRSSTGLCGPRAKLYQPYSEEERKEAEAALHNLIKLLAQQAAREQWFSEKPTPELVIIAEYDHHWPQQFEALARGIKKALGALALRIEHVGSTSIKGLPAKPIIDLDIVIERRSHLPAVIEALRRIGYKHQGDLGIAGREAFQSPDGAVQHHLYVCEQDSPELMRHLLFRNALRNDPGMRKAYGDLKCRLAGEHGDDREVYTKGKADFIHRVLRDAISKR